jgi:hypothetical protein
MKRTADELIADALIQEEKLDRAEIAPIYAQAGIAARINELRHELRMTNRLLAAFICSTTTDATAMNVAVKVLKDGV